MKPIVKLITDKNVLYAIVSAISALVCAFFAGCKLYCGELAVKEFSAEIFGQYNSTTNHCEVNR